MTAIEMQANEKDVSLFALGTTLLRYRRRIAIWMVVGLLVAIIPVLLKPPLYKSTASFVPQGADATRSGLASLAGQFGVGISTGNATQSPEFYAELVTSRELLAPIVRDTFQIPVKSPKPETFLQLFKFTSGSPELREAGAVKLLRGMISTSVSKETGVVQITVTTEWPRFSQAVAQKLVSGIDEFNRRTRQTQAAAERKFIEGRLSLANIELRAAEDRLQRFLQTNRDVGGSAELGFQRDRLQRDVGLQQQVYTSLTQAYEDARVREVRDTPVITVIESPSVPALPEPRGRARRVLLGVLLGALIGFLIALGSELISRRRDASDRDADEFFAMLASAKSEATRPFRRRTS